MGQCARKFPAPHNVDSAYLVHTATVENCSILPPELREGCLIWGLRMDSFDNPAVEFEEV